MDFGKRGDDPRHKLGPDDERLPVFKTALTIGTVKGTAHIPGYQGFLATNTRNRDVARAGHGGTLRSVDKTNLTEQFHKDLLGYAGHIPVNSGNDKGPVATSMLTSTGRDFSLLRS